MFESAACALHIDDAVVIVRYVLHYFCTGIDHSDEIFFEGGTFIVVAWVESELVFVSFMLECGDEVVTHEKWGVVEDVEVGDDKC